MARRARTAAPWPATGAAEPTLVPERNPRVSGVEIDDESVLYDARDGRLHILNWSASAVWWALDGRTSIDELAADLAGRFHAERAAMRSDIVTLLGVLGAESLVDAVPARPPRGSHA